MLKWNCGSGPWICPGLHNKLRKCRGGTVQNQNLHVPALPATCTHQMALKKATMVDTDLHPFLMPLALTSVHWRMHNALRILFWSWTYALSTNGTSSRYQEANSPISATQPEMELVDWHASRRVLIAQACSTYTVPWSSQRGWALVMHSVITCFRRDPCWFLLIPCIPSSSPTCISGGRWLRWQSKGMYKPGGPGRR